MKPILFNTEMVRAILDGHKTVTRRAVKHYDRTPLSVERANLYKMVEELNGKPYFGAGFYGDTDIFFVDGKKIIDARYFKAPYRPGDILYVRETWQFLPCIDCMEENCGRAPEQYENAEIVAEGCYLYKENVIAPERVFWRPSIHMPKKAARIFLRVTNVRVERLQDITWKQAASEGCSGIISDTPDLLFGLTPIRENFRQLWDSTIKKADLPIYGWAANPWVWVIEFERISKEEAD